jgi:hypothetical protein
MSKTEKPIMHRHPSYGVIHMNRFQGSGAVKLFGSQTRNHSGVCLSISPAEWHHDLGRDTIWGARVPIIEVNMSEAQLGSMLSAMGIGEGVPCTITHLNGEPVPEAPDTETEPTRIRDSFNEVIGKMALDLRGSLPVVEAILDKEGTLSKTDRKVLRDAFAAIHQSIKSSAEFYMQQFQESAERTVAAAKAEVNTYVQRVATSKGINLVADMNPLNLTEAES